MSKEEAKKLSSKQGGTEKDAHPSGSKDGLGGSAPYATPPQPVVQTPPQPVVQTPPPPEPQALSNGPYQKIEKSEVTAPAIAEATNRSTIARDASRGERVIGSEERSLAGQISRDYDKINNYAAPLVSSPDPEIRSRGHQFLSQSVSPPAKFADIYGALDLNKNKDVLEKGPQYVDNLANASKDHEKEAAFLEDQAAKSDKAAAAMAGFTKTLDQRISNLQSIDEKSFISAGDKKDRETSAYPVKDESLTLAKVDNAKVTTKIDSTLTSKDSESADGKGDKLLSPKLAGSDSTIASGRKLASLSDRLRQSLAEKAKETTKAEGESKPKSSFDSIFEAKPEGKGAATSDATSANKRGEDGSGIGSERAFDMSGVETEMAVKKLMANLDPASQSADLDPSVFGNANETIFKRMSKYLTRAQANKRLSSK